jgi:hypothetical protein
MLIGYSSYSTFNTKIDGFNREIVVHNFACRVSTSNQYDYGIQFTRVAKMNKPNATPTKKTTNLIKQLMEPNIRNSKKISNKRCRFVYR